MEMRTDRVRPPKTKMKQKKRTRTCYSARIPKHTNIYARLKSALDKCNDNAHKHNTSGDNKFKFIFTVLFYYNPAVSVFLLDDRKYV